MPGARLNIADVALSGRDPDAPAMLWADEDSPSLVHTLSLGQLRRESEQVAASLLAFGMQPGHHTFLTLSCFPYPINPLLVRAHRSSGP